MIRLQWTGGGPSCSRWLAASFALWGVVFVFLTGCGRGPLPATVEGTLYYKDAPLDNCLVCFFPEPGQAETIRSTGWTDAEGRFQLRCDDLRDGAVVGRHRVTVTDLSVSTGVARRDNGTIDAEPDERTPPPVRGSRVPARYTSEASTPLRRTVQSGHQTIELRLE